LDGSKGLAGIPGCLTDRAKNPRFPLSFPFVNLTGPDGFGIVKNFLLFGVILMGRVPPWCIPASLLLVPTTATVRLTF